jgi:hypothetical protein
VSTRHPEACATKALLLALLLACPAFAQFQFFLVEGAAERAAPSLYDLGSLYTGESASARFRLRNISAAPAAVTALTAAGAGFTLTAPALPVTLAPQSALDFTVAFRAADIGSYSAALRSDGVSILLTATVLPRLTLSGSFDFGSVVRTTTAQQRFTLANQTPQTLIVPAIGVVGSDFSLAGIPPSGQAFQPQQTGGFTVVFAPRATGPSQGTLTVGDRSYPLTGVGMEPPLPKPLLTVDLPQVASAQQGLAIIRFDTVVRTSGAGSLTLDFRGPADPTLAFASGGRTAAFTIAAGDAQVAVPFQTGTTAGTLTFTAQIGSSTDQLIIAIPAAPPAIVTAQGARSASSVDVTLTGFDNTRTAGALTFNFYDASGSVLPPGAIPADATAEFAKYFPASAAGGTFQLRATFPVTGDTSRITAFDVTLTNSSGNTKSARVAF